MLHVIELVKIHCWSLLKHPDSCRQVSAGVLNVYSLFIGLFISYDLLGTGFAPVLWLESGDYVKSSARLQKTPNDYILLHIVQVYTVYIGQRRPSLVFSTDSNIIDWVDLALHIYLFEWCQTIEITVEQLVHYVLSRHQNTQFGQQYLGPCSTTLSCWLWRLKPIMSCKWGYSSLLDYKET